MDKISAIILTFNEEKNIERCIRSVLPVADEIIVIDSYSSDATESICRSFSEVKFIQHPFDGYIEQKNYGKEMAIYDLILSLDADEALSPELQESIAAVKRSRQKDSYTMNRLTNYCGQWIYHSGWYPDRKMRLFDRRKGHWGGKNPHDKFIPGKEATTGHLRGDILHYSYYTRDEHREQVKKFAAIAANSLFRSGEKSGYLKIVYKPVARFIKSYLLNAGFRDGKAGWIIACMTAKSSFLRYSQLYRLNKGK